ncbi:MAG TPA: POTRA domain-containing protein, partial [Myxococcota bacterium]
MLTRLAVPPRPVATTALVAALVALAPIMARAQADTETPGSAGPPSAPAAPNAPSAAAPDMPADVAPAEAPPAVATYPLLEAVDFENKSYFRDETLRSFMLHPVPGDLDRAMLEADANRIADRYRDRGFLKASVKLRIVPGQPPRGVRAVFTINAGERAELKRVKVVGNVDVPEAQLKEGFFSRPPEMLGLLTRAGFFHRPYVDQDGQRLVANYYKRGYLEARVLDTIVEADPALDGLSITMRVIEGPVYELGSVRFDGDVPKDANLDDMRKRITIKDGDVCDLVSIQQQADALLDPLREAGHPFARFEQAVQVVPPPSGNPKHRAVALTLRFVAGPAPLVRKVIIAGTKGTADRVIRRDVEVKEGASYDHKAVKQTERNLMATGFFSAAQAHAVPIQDQPNVVDVEVDVTEQQTWLASIAPAFDTNAGGEGLIGVGILADRNFLGSGIFVSAFARVSSLKQTFDLSA